MRGLMMDTPLLISQLLDHAAVVHTESEIVTRTVEGPIHRYTWNELSTRSKALAAGLTNRGIREGDRIGTIAWNGFRHMELYYGVSGMGAVIHTVNPRLHPSQLVYIVNHAADRMLFVDATFLPLVEAVSESLDSVKHVVVMTDRENGLLVDFFDVDTLANRLYAAITRPEDLAPLRAAARQTIIDRYPLERSIGRYMSLMRQLMES